MIMKLSGMSSNCTLWVFFYFLFFCGDTVDRMGWRSEAKLTPGLRNGLRG